MSVQQQSLDLEQALRMAVRAFNGGDFAQAERLTRQVLRVVPGHPVGCHLLGRLALKAGKPDRAVELLQTAVSAAPGDAEAQLALAEAFGRVGEAERAVAACQRAVELRPGHAHSLFALGNFLQQTERTGEAAECYRRALAAKVPITGLRNNAATAFLKLGETAEATALVEAQLATDPLDVRANALKSVLLFEAGDLDAAAELLRPEITRKSALLDVPDGYPDLAAFNRAFETAIRTHPNRQSDTDPSQRAIRGGDAVLGLFDHDDPAIRAFEATLKVAVAGYIAALPEVPGHPYLGCKPDDYTLDGWANILREDGHQASHIHNLGWMSGTYYVAVPDRIRADDPAREGWLEFDRPGYGIPGRYEIDFQAVCPEEGRYAFFPSYTWHRTVPFRGDQERISIAVDLHPRR